MIRITLIRRVTILVLLLSASFPLAAQKNGIPPETYVASAIPDSLKKDADYVTRYYSMEMLVKQAAKAVIRCHSIRTILNEKAESEAVMAVGYDKKFSSVNNMEMTVYDATGKVIKRYKKGDMYDHSAVDNISLITDARVLYASHDITSYPVTVEQIFEKNLNSFLDLGAWTIGEEKESIQLAKCKISVNPAVGFRYKVKNVDLPPKRSTEDGLEVYQWEVRNQRPVKKEEDCPAWRVRQQVSFATNQIECDGVPGDMSSWKGFGLWQQALNKNVSSLSPKREEEIRQMVSSLPSDKEKAKFLYEYMQKNMRYVSIQLGIGGLKPFPASFVDEKKYGDCKALANYMYTLLKTVGIPSYYTLIRAGENEEPADPNFVNDPFNHIVLCIPFKNDTTWLECTSTTKPFGKLGTFTENRNGLLVTEDGGKLVRTPASRMEDNVFDSETNVTIAEDGTAKAKVVIRSSGGYRDLFIGLSASKTDDQKKYLINYLNLRQPDILEFTSSSDKDGIRETGLDLAYESLSDMKAGDKYFYRPRLFDLFRATVPVMEKRKTDFYFSHPLLKKNVTSITIPSSYEVEALPTEVNLSFKYGQYQVRYSYDAEKHEIKSISSFSLSRHVIPAAQYSDMQKFLDELSKSLSKKLVIKKKA